MEGNDCSIYRFYLTMVSRVQVPTQGKENTFIQTKEKLGGRSKQALGFLLAESLRGKKRSESFFLMGFATFEGCESSPFWSPNSLN